MLIEWLVTRYLRHIVGAHMRFDDEPVGGRPPSPRRGHEYLLYVHIPFCEVLCPFCPFHRVRFREPQASRYFAALRQEIRSYHECGFDFSGVYVGGGTPTVIPEELAETLALIRSLYAVNEISVETNPNHLRAEVVSLLKAAGVNRLSVGVQSFDDVLLKEMGRYDSYGSSAFIVERLNSVQGVFDTLNADMMFNLPHQTLASLQKDLRILADNVKVDQVSFYPLMTAPRTRQAMSLTMGEVTFHREKSFYQTILAAMKRGYQPSSAWCFSRGNSMIDEYIVDYDEYVGVGSGAFSYVNGTMYSSTFSTNRYIDHVDGGRTGITAARRLDPREQMDYDFLMKLFSLSMDKKAIEAKYDGAFHRALWKELLAFKLLGALVEEGGRYRVTEKGMYYWVMMMREFFMGVNRLRDAMRLRIREEWRSEHMAVAPGGILRTTGSEGTARRGVS